MSDVIETERPPLGIRLLHALATEPDWSAMTAEELVTYREAENRKRSSRLVRVITGLPDRGATVEWREVALPDRKVRVRVYRPSSAEHAQLPLVLHVHGGGFVGTAAQCDWVNSHLAARLPSVVVSVEHRLLDSATPLSAAVDDGWDVLRHVVGDAARWGVDPAGVALFGESAGSMVTALAAIRAGGEGLPVRAQVLVNPCTDLTSTMLDYPSMTRHAPSPTRWRITAAATPSASARRGPPSGSPSIRAPRTRSSACRAWCHRRRPRGRPSGSFWFTLSGNSEERACFFVIMWFALPSLLRLAGRRRTSRGQSATP